MGLGSWHFGLASLEAGIFVLGLSASNGRMRRARRVSEDFFGLDGVPRTPPTMLGLYKYRGFGLDLGGFI